MQKFERAPGNESVVAMLEQYLEMARKGHADWVGIAMCEGDQFRSDYTGATRSNFSGNFAVDQLKQKITNPANIRSAPKRDGQGPANMWRYDISTEPVCHDFIVWMVMAEMTRVREDYPPPLRVGFFRVNDEDKMPASGLAYRNQFFNNVMIPSLELFGAVADPMAVEEGRSQQVYAPKQIVDAFRNGEPVPRVRVPLRASATVAAHLGGDVPVTITLRETGAFTHRNSNIGEWCLFAAWLKQRNERVIFVRDTAKADEPLEPYETLPAASRNVHVRVALYEQAKANFFVSNGPMGWGLFGTKPFFAFHTVDDNEPSHCNQPEFWRRYNGIEPGEQYPWCGPQQRIVYADDTFENMRASWIVHFN